MVHHNNYFAKILPIVFAQIFFSHHLLKQIIGNNIKEYVITLLKSFDD